MIRFVMKHKWKTCDIIGAWQMSELRDAKKLVADWTPHKECGYSVPDDFVNRLRVMRLVAENCAYWRTQSTQKFLIQHSWKVRALKRYQRFVQYIFSKGKL